MQKRITFVLFALVALSMLVSNIFCNSKASSKQVYLNHNDTVKYVGIEQCASCHADIYESFLKTGMGQSFAPATKLKSAAKFGNHHVVFDSIKNFYYQAFWIQDSMYIKEFRLKGKDTIYKRIERVDYIIGSGQHTNSHFTNINGFVYQLPLTWYTQKQQWDLPPGFENGRNVRFNRSIEFECMSCHNAMPVVEPNSVNKFVKIPNGIDCERCHGPGEVHVKEKLAGKIVDTANYIDYTIVNPKKLSFELQTDVCQRCHLQGNAVLQNGKSFADFKPGMRLQDFVEVYMPKYTDNNSFIMASHAQRLQMSKCFITSNSKTSDEHKEFNTLNLTCITCHNPHISVKETGKQIFNNACIKCHQSENNCTEKKEILTAKNNNCVGCHMPKSGTEDIPHVTVHDHYIRKPQKPNLLKTLQIFEGIYCVNNSTCLPQNKVMAYLNYFEKFEGNESSLDSAFWWIEKIGMKTNTISLKIQYHFLTGNYREIAALSNQVVSKIDAWSAYRIGQAFQNLGNSAMAVKWYAKAVNQASENLSFLNKLGSAQIENKKFSEAITTYLLSLKKQPKQEDAWVNLGFAYLQTNNANEALNCYNNALKLNPDNTQALLNRAAVLNMQGNKKGAINDLKLILKLDSNNAQVKELLLLLNG